MFCTTCIYKFIEVGTVTQSFQIFERKINSYLVEFANIAIETDCPSDIQGASKHTEGLIALNLH
jgi:hypothetical protein